MAAVSILDINGNPLQRAKASMLPGARASAGGYDTPYRAASQIDSESAAWNPYLGSPDIELNPFRDRIVSRVRDLVRNDGWANGGVTTLLDNMVGASFRLISKPDYKALATLTGNKGFDFDWADEFGRAVEAAWRTWSEDPGRWSDASRHHTFTQMTRLAFRHKLIDGDALALLLWNKANVKPGKAKFATTVMLIDPDRLSNPQQTFDTQSIRGGVEIDSFGAAQGYWIRDAHPGDWYSADKSLKWTRVARETPTGRPIVVHNFDAERAGQTRGGAGIFTPVLNRFHMLTHYDRTELQAAIVNSVFAAYIESPFDQTLTQDAFGETEQLGGYQGLRNDFHQGGRLMVGDVKMPMLFPGEKINTVSPTRPNSNFDGFEQAVLRSVASATGMSAEQLTKDYSKTNYSSARAALLEAWKTMSRRRDDFAIGFCQPIYSAWLEEALSGGLLPLPPGAPSFLEMRAAYSRCKFIGPGRGWVDPLKERQASVLSMQGGLSTLESEVAENNGEDYEEVLDQRAREIAYFKKLGMPAPTWANIIPDETEAAAGNDEPSVVAKPKIE